MNRMNPETLSSLQSRIAQSDLKAFEELYGLFASRLFNFAKLYVHKNEIAEEIVQDIMVKVWSKRDGLHEVRNLETYLFVATRNHCLNHLAQYSQYYISSIGADQHAEIISLHDPARELEWKEISFRLSQAIEELPDQCRTVFKLIKEEGFRYKQVAEILGISPRTVETHLFRAIKKLDEVIAVYRDKPAGKPGGNIPLLGLLLFLPVFIF